MFVALRIHHVLFIILRHQPLTSPAMDEFAAANTAGISSKPASAHVVQRITHGSEFTESEKGGLAGAGHKSVQTPLC